MAFDYNQSDISLDEILGSLRLEANDGSWYKPPGYLSQDYLVGDDAIFVWLYSGEPVHLRFSRYRFSEAEIFISTEEQVRDGNLSGKMDIGRASFSTPNSLKGKIALSDGSQPSRIHVTLFDPSGPNRGFMKGVRTDKDGIFQISEIPNGRFELAFVKPSYVRYTLIVDIQEGILRCLANAMGHYDNDGIDSCDLSSFGLKLHPIREIKIQWALQKERGINHFRDVFRGDVKLKSALSYDWSRGNWLCCESSFTFGVPSVDAPEPDILIFTDTGGAFYFGQPHSAFIANNQRDFDELVEIPKNLALKSRAQVREGETYILKINPSNASTDALFFAKIKVISIQ